MNATEKSRTEADQITRPPRSHARVSVVIPTFNEAANLPHVFARLPFERAVRDHPRRRALDR